MKAVPKPASKFLFWPDTVLVDFLQCLPYPVWRKNPRKAHVMEGFRKHFQNPRRLSEQLLEPLAGTVSESWNKLSEEGFSKDFQS
jgi:hypothetical protein